MICSLNIFMMMIKSMSIKKKSMVILLKVSIFEK